MRFSELRSLDNGRLQGRELYLTSESEHEPQRADGVSNGAGIDESDAKGEGSGRHTRRRAQARERASVNELFASLRQSAVSQFRLGRLDEVDLAAGDLDQKLSGGHLEHEGQVEFIGERVENVGAVGHGRWCLRVWFVHHGHFHHYGVVLMRVRWL